MLEGRPSGQVNTITCAAQATFDRVMAFLLLLREMNMYSMVMLTLTRANMDQVLPLAEILQGKADLFTFNRLAMMGEGAALASVDSVRYLEFLERFVNAAAINPVLSLKDNLCNLHHFSDLDRYCFQERSRTGS